MVHYVSIIRRRIGPQPGPIHSWSFIRLHEAFLADFTTISLSLFPSKQSQFVLNGTDVRSSGTAHPADLDNHQCKAISSEVRLAILFV